MNVCHEQLLLSDTGCVTCHSTSGMRATSQHGSSPLSLHAAGQLHPASLVRRDTKPAVVALGMISQYRLSTPQMPCAATTRTLGQASVRPSDSAWNWRTSSSSCSSVDASGSCSKVAMTAAAWFCDSLAYQRSTRTHRNVI
jgi:hypothetical protein